MQVEEIDFSNNSAELLPKDVEKLTTLKKLDLSFNRFNEFPTDLCTVTSLKEVNLASNSLQDVPYEFKTVSAKKGLDSKAHMNCASFKGIPTKTCAPKKIDYIC